MDALEQLKQRMEEAGAAQSGNALGDAESLRRLEEPDEEARELLANPDLVSEEELEGEP